MADPYGDEHIDYYDPDTRSKPAIPRPGQNVHKLSVRVYPWLDKAITWAATRERMAGRRSDRSYVARQLLCLGIGEYRKLGALPARERTGPVRPANPAAHGHPEDFD